MAGQDAGFPETQVWERGGRQLHVAVDEIGRVTITIELLAQILRGLGFSKVDNA